MLKERLIAKKPHRKLFEFQLLECFILIIVFALSYDIAWNFIYHSFFPFFILNEHLRHISITVLVITILSFYKFFNFLDQSFTEAVKKIVASDFLLNMVFVVMLYFASNTKLSAYYFITAYILQIILLLFVKVVTNIIRRNVIRNSLNLVITKDYYSSDLIMSIRKECNGRLVIVSYDDKNLNKYVGKADNIYLTGSVTNDLRSSVVSFCTLEDKKVFIVPEIFEIAVRNSAITNIGDTPVFAMDSFHLTEVQRFVKRTVDIVLSLLGIVISLPVFLFAVIGIKHEDKGPIFYKQERSGLQGKPFEIIKFRSMVVDAEKDTGAVLAAENDHRVTKIGYLMRSTRIDEIPQFFNVLMGSMSLVGPRPERPVFVEEYSKLYSEYQYRLAVKPGITGLAQVRGNYSTTAENKIKFDLMYIINYSLLLDLKILFQTVMVVLNREQAKGVIQNEPDCFISVEDIAQNDIKRRLLQIIKMYERQ